MPDGEVNQQIPLLSTCSLKTLQVDKQDGLGARVCEIVFKGEDYAIYCSDRGIYVHFSDDPMIEKKQRQAYTLLSGQICELRYLTSQMSRQAWFGTHEKRRGQTIYDHNMAQALMLMMESQAQRADTTDHQTAQDTENRAKDIANRALDMAIARVTTDNTIRYVGTGVLTGIVLSVLAILLLQILPDNLRLLGIASLAGAVGATLSLIFRAQSFQVKPCDDSRLNKIMAMIRILLGAIAGPALYLLLDSTLADSNLFGSGANVVAASIKVAALGLVAGFVERLVPNLLQSTADKLEGTKAGTPVQAATMQAKA